jgi:hypothetical protein
VHGADSGAPGRLDVQGNMPFFSHAGDRTTAMPARLRGPDGEAAQAAQVLQAIWVDIDAALMPIVGVRGLAALCVRSLHLTRLDFAWLGAAIDGQPEAQQGVEAICAVLAVQDDVAAAACAQTFLRNFRDLLTSLIGASLTERLLRAAWTDSTSSDFISGAAAQDPLS